MEPVLNIPRGQQDLPPSSADSLTLSWQPGPEGTEFRSELSGADGFQQSLEWQVSSRWEVGSLKPGEYTWIVFSRNLAGTSSSSVQFSVKEQDYPPVTQLKPLPERSGSSVLLLEWDVLEGSERVERFELQVREGEGEWFAWGRPLPGQSRSGWYFGEPGKTYTFRIRSIDINGALEGFAENGEVKVEIAPGCEPDIHEAEKLGGDDHFLDASVMGVNTSEEHSLCTQGDVDWVSFKAEMGRSYRISTTPLSGGAAVRIQLFAPDGYNLLGEKDPSGLMQPAEINWIAPEEGTYLVRLSSTDPKVYGGDVRYQVRIDAMERVFTPGLLFSTLILPVIWFVIRFFNRKSSVEKKPKHSKTREKFRAAEKGWPGPEA
jgi:hypothetical protein